MRESYYKRLIFSAFGSVVIASLFITNFVIGAGSGRIISPQAAERDPFDQVQVKLENYKNNMKLSRNVSFIEEAGAAGDFNDASAYIVVDADSGEIILEKNSAQISYIASITKIMTAVTVLDIASKDETIRISAGAPKVEPTNMGVVTGQDWSVGELLHGLLLTSANDSAEAIKDGVDAKYGEGTFIRAMNAKAKFIGLRNTSFDNPQGYDGPANFSTTEDLAVLTMYIYKNYPLIAEIAQKEYQFFPESEVHNKADLINWNGLLGVYPGVYGLKIGNTGKAQKTTVVIAEREGKKVLVVLLGAPGVLERDFWTAQLLDLGFNKKFGLENVNITEERLKEKYTSWRELAATFE